MTHRFPIKEIARQSGLSTATIDRAINKRAHVSAQTKARVDAAIVELQAQEAQLAARGRRMFFDFVIEAPARFSREVKDAAHSAQPRITGAVCRSRFVIQEIMDADQVAATLDRIAKRGSQGVCLKARDLPEIRAAVNKLVAAGIPVVTLVTDLTDTRRLAYVGLDNQSAGQTAAYLIAKGMRDQDGVILTSRSNNLFLGEKERHIAFRDTLAELMPDASIIDVSGGSGLHFETTKVMAATIGDLDHLNAVYSMGGGNRTITQLLAQHHLQTDVYVAHDLDADNRDLIATGSLSFILHHDLSRDLESVFHAFLFHHKLTATPPQSTMSNIQVITPHNVPPKQRA